MPGIAGIISKNIANPYDDELDAMLNCMMHESFYLKRSYIQREDGIYIGWAGHNADHSDGMALSNLNNEIILAFAGDNPINMSLNGKPADASQQPERYSADQMVRQYIDHPAEFLKTLNGWFSGLLVDNTLQKAILFNDRYGINRIYYTEDSETFCFSSEAKALLQRQKNLREFDLEGIAEYIVSGGTMMNRSLFKNIQLLPGGSAWEFRKQQPIKKKSYFHIDEWENQENINQDDIFLQLKDVFRRILPIYFRPEGKVGMSLTGGLDTRMIMSSYPMSCNEFPCYTYSSNLRESLDSAIARKVANGCGQPYEKLTLETDFFHNFDNYARRTIYLTDGYLDVRNAFELYFSQKARELAPIRITGNYGSELVRNVDYIKPSMQCAEIFNKDFTPLLTDAVARFTDARNMHPKTYGAFRLIPWYMYGRLAVARSQLTFRTPYMDNRLVGMLYRIPPELQTSRELSLRLIADGNPSIAAIPTDRGIVYKPATLLTKMRKLYYEGLFKAEYLFNDGMPRWLARADFLIRPLKIETFFLGRHKLDFPRIWFRDQLAAYVKSILLDTKSLTRSYLNKGAIEKMITLHTTGSHNYSMEINLALSLELLQRCLFENE